MWRSFWLTYQNIWTIDYDALSNKESDDGDVRYKDDDK